MASNINSLGIDENYPIAGQDNDSQGFRDNFNVIKNSLASASTEITDLQNNTAKLNSLNDFNGEIIQNASFQQTSDEVFNIGNATQAFNINWEDGNYQIMTTAADIPSITFSNFPANKLGKIRVVVTGPSGSDTWNFSFAGTFKDNGNFSVNNSIGQNEIKIFDFWSTNGGETIYADYLGLYT